MNRPQGKVEKKKKRTKRGELGLYPKSIPKCEMNLDCKVFSREDQQKAWDARVQRLTQV